MNFYFSRIAFKQANYLKIEKDISKKLSSLWKASQAETEEDLFPSEYAEMNTEQTYKEYI